MLPTEVPNPEEIALDDVDEGEDDFIDGDDEEAEEQGGARPTLDAALTAVFQLVAGSSAGAGRQRQQQAPVAVENPEEIDLGEED